VPSRRAGESDSKAGEDSLSGWQLKGSLRSLPMEQDVPTGVRYEGPGERDLKESDGGDESRGEGEHDRDGGGGCDRGNWVVVEEGWRPLG
jgi:hypothetical protein